MIQRFSQFKICNEVIKPRRNSELEEFRSNYKLEASVSLFVARGAHHSSFKRSGYHFRIKERVLGATKKSQLTCVILASRRNVISIQLFHNIISFNLQRNVSSDYYFLVEVRNILFFNIEFPVEASQRSIVYLIRG